MNNLTKTILAFSLTSQIIASTSFGGTCVSQGTWTATALANSQDIKNVLRQLQDDENCTGIFNAFSGIQMPNYSIEDNEAKEVMEGNISSIASSLKSGEPANPGVLNSLLGNMIDRAGLSFKTDAVNTKRKAAMEVGMQGLNNLFDQLPKYDSCLIGNSGLAASLLTGSIKMMSAYASSGETNLSKFGDTLNKFTKFMRMRKFSKVINKLDEVQMAMSISCILESASENYCKAKDAYELLDFATKEDEVYLKAKQAEKAFNPLEGYFVLTRETPIISEWLQKVMFGVTPRTIADSDFKNQVIENVNDFLKQENALYGYIEQQSLEFMALSGIDSRRNHVFEMVRGVSNQIQRGAGRGDAGINFFERSMLLNKIPFYLIGRDEIPAEVAANNEGRFVMDPWQYMEQGGQFLPEFTNPAELLETVKARLASLISLAKNNASLYFQQRLIVDKQNLVAESFVSQTISVFEAFHRIDSYLTKLIERAKETRTDADLGVLATMIQTRGNIRNIIEQYDRLKTNLNQKFDNILAGNIDQSIAEDEEVYNIILDIIAKVYLEFNVILQRDTYILNRMATIVRYDYMYYTKNSEMLTDYQRDLLTVASKNIIELLTGSYQKNPALVKQDLAAAQVINRTNIAALEEIFRDSMFQMIARMKLVADGKGDSWWNQWTNSWARWWRDADEHNGITTKLATSDEHTSVIGRINDDFADPIMLIYSSFMRRDRYRVSGRIFERATIERDDVYGSFEQLKSRFCFQTLPFSNYFAYYDRLCENSRLDGIATDNNRLNSEYNTYYQNYVQADIARDNKRMQVLKDDNICALRDYRRKNHVYWLTTEFGSL